MPYKEDNLTMSGLLRKPAFIVQVLLSTTLLGIFLGSTIGKHWPAFHNFRHWISFMQIGVCASLYLIEFSTLTTWVVFQHNNWAHYFYTYFMHSALLIVCGIFFFYTYFNPSSTRHWWSSHSKDLEPYTVGEFLTQICLLIIAVCYLAYSFCFLIFREKIFK